MFGPIQPLAMLSSADFRQSKNPVAICRHFMEDHREKPSLKLDWLGHVAYPLVN